MTELPPKKDRLRKDISSCLEITDALHPFIVPPGEFTPGAATIDEEVKTSAEATFIKVCNKLDDLIDGLGKAEDPYDKKLLAVADAEIEARKGVATTAKHTRRPSILYQPTIGKHPSGSWCVFYGDISDDKSCVIGVGNTVEAAMLDFDNEWRGRSKVRKARPQTTQSPKSDTSKGRKK